MVRDAAVAPGVFLPPAAWTGLAGLGELGARSYLRALFNQGPGTS